MPSPVHLTGNQIRVIQIDDDKDHLFLMKLNLERVNPGLEVVGFTDVDLFFDEVSRKDLDCIITDYKMATMDGVSLAIKVRETTDTPIILYTGRGSEEIAERAFNAGIDDYVRKDVGLDHYMVLSKNIENLVEKARHKKDLARKTRILEDLHHYSTILAQATSLEEIVSTIHETIDDIFKPDSGSFAFVRGNVLRHEFIWSMGKYHVVEMPLEGKGITVRAVNEGVSQLVKNIEDDPEYRSFFPDTETKSELAVPIKINGVVIAVLNLESNEAFAFDENDQRLLEIFSEHVAVSMERLNQKQLIEKMERLRIRETLEGYKKISQMVRHDLRNPINNLRLALKVIRENPEKYEEMIETMEKNVHFAEEIMNDWKLQTMSGDLQIQPVSVLELVRDSLEFVEKPENVNVTVNIQEDLVIPLDYNRMKRAFVNLIINSYEAMPDGGELEISSHAASGETEITVKDSGVGMTKEQMHNLFQPFFTTKAYGTGLGLAYCKQTINDHNGEIYVDSEIMKGTKFRIVFTSREQERPDQVENEFELIQFTQV